MISRSMLASKSLWTRTKVVIIPFYFLYENNETIYKNDENQSENIGNVTLGLYSTLVFSIDLSIFLRENFKFRKR